MEFETPEMTRRENGFINKKLGDESLGRTRSAVKDPGVVGPIVWDLRRQRAVEGFYFMILLFHYIARSFVFITVI